MSKAFFDSVRRNPFGGSLTQDQVGGMSHLRAAWGRYGDGDRRKLAYILATTFHETARKMQPITEYGQREYFNKYEGRGDLGNVIAGDGYKFRGRGYVQITGRRNYYDWEVRLGIDLTTYPEKTLEPDIAVRIIIEGMMLGTFTGKDLTDYINSNGCNYYEARRIVNGLDRATTIAGYAQAFQAALDAETVLPATEAAPIAPPAPTPAPGPFPPVYQDTPVLPPPSGEPAVEPPEWNRVNVGIGITAAAGALAGILKFMGMW